MLALLLDREAAVSLGPDTVDGLAVLGVTHIAILGDERTLAVVLDGWAFDPGSSAEAARSLLAGEGSARVRTLDLSAQLVLSPAHPT
jgi:hypothetical protein